MTQVSRKGFVDKNGKQVILKDQTKADKVENATAGNLASLDTEGNPQDSGKKPTDFAPAVHLHEEIRKDEQTGGSALVRCRVSEEGEGSVKLSVQDGNGEISDAEINTGNIEHLKTVLKGNFAPHDSIGDEVEGVQSGMVYVDNHTQDTPKIVFYLHAEGHGPATNSVELTLENLVILEKLLEYGMSRIQSSTSDDHSYSRIKSYMNGNESAGTDEGVIEFLVKKSSVTRTAHLHSDNIGHLVRLLNGSCANYYDGPLLIENNVTEFPVLSNQDITENLDSFIEDAEEGLQYLAIITVEKGLNEVTFPCVISWENALPNEPKVTIRITNYIFTVNRTQGVWEEYFGVEDISSFLTINNA